MRPPEVRGARMLPSARRSGGDGKTPTASRRAWSHDEDARLRAAVDKHGPQKWLLIAAAVGTRPEKSCRERWHNHLRPDVQKSAWTPEEDAIILAGVAELGTSWSCIADRLQGRSDHAIKNRYNSITRRRRSSELSAPAWPQQQTAGHAAPDMTSSHAARAPIMAVPCVPAAPRALDERTGRELHQPVVLAAPCASPVATWPQWQQPPPPPPQLDSSSDEAAGSRSCAAVAGQAQKQAQGLSAMRTVQLLQAQADAQQQQHAPSSSQPPAGQQAPPTSAAVDPLIIRRMVSANNTTPGSMLAEQVMMALAAGMQEEGYLVNETAAELPVAVQPPAAHHPPTSPHTLASVVALAKQLVHAYHAGSAVESEAAGQALVEQMQHVLAPKPRRPETNASRQATEELSSAVGSASLGHSACAHALQAARDRRGSCDSGLASMHTFGPGSAPRDVATDRAAAQPRQLHTYPPWEAAQRGVAGQRADGLPMASLQQTLQQQRQQVPLPSSAQLAPPELMGGAMRGPHASSTSPQGHSELALPTDPRKRALDDANYHLLLAARQHGAASAPRPPPQRHVAPRHDAGPARQH